MLVPAMHPMRIMLWGLMYSPAFCSPCSLAVGMTTQCVYILTKRDVSLVCHLVYSSLLFLYLCFAPRMRNADIIWISESCVSCLTCNLVYFLHISSLSVQPGQGIQRIHNLVDVVNPFCVCWLDPCVFLRIFWAWIGWQHRKFNICGL